MDKTADSMRQLKSKVGDWFGIAMPGAGSDAEPPREQTMLEELDEMTSLTWQQRMTGFAMALGMGILFIVLAMTFVPVLALFPQKFAFFYSVGSLFCVCSTAFLVGLRKQLTMMFEAHRAEAAAAYFGCLVLTLFSAVHLKSAILSFFFAGCQIVAVVWYSMSYIPFARQFFMTFGGYVWAAVKPVLSAAGSCIMGCCRMIW